MRLPVRTHSLRRPELGGIARSFVLVGGATAIGQGAIILASPVLTRLYDPDAFGLLAVYIAMLSILVSVASLRFDLAIPISDDGDEAIHLLLLSSLIAAGTSIVLVCVLAFWGHEIAVALSAELLSAALWLLPVAVFMASVAQALASWATYERRFSALGRMRAAQGLSQAVGQVLLGLAQVGAIGLIMGDVAGRVLGAEQLLRSSLVRLRSSRPSVALLRACARARWGFARVMVTASFLSSLSVQVPFLLIPAFFDLGLSGQYFLAYRVLALPASLVVAAVAQVFFGEASFRRAHPERLHDLAYAAAASLLVFSIPTYTIVAVTGQAVVTTIFGSDWQLAGLYAQIMAPSLIFWTVANPMASLPLVGGRERQNLGFTAAELTLKTVAIGIGAAANSLTTGVVCLSITSIAIESAAMWRFLRVANVGLRELMQPISRIVARTLPFAALALAVGYVAPGVVPLAALLAWSGAMALAVRASPEVRSLVSEVDEDA